MKKFILIFVLALFAFVTVPEFTSTAEGQIYTQTGTLTDAGTTNLDISATGKYSSVSMDVIFTEVSGTSAGWTTLLARNGASDTWTKIGEVTDGNWIDMSSSLDSVAIADALHWRVSIRQPAFTNYRIRSIGTGTQSTTIDMYYTFKKY